MLSRPAGFNHPIATTTPIVQAVTAMEKHRGIFATPVASLSRKLELQGS
jgi:hypothetical protein